MDKYVINIHSKKTFWFSFCLFKLKIMAIVNKNKAQSFAEWLGQLPEQNGVIRNVHYI